MPPNIRSVDQRGFLALAGAYGDTLACEYVRGAVRYLRLLLREEYTPDAQVFDMERHRATNNNRPKNGDASAQ